MADAFMAYKGQSVIVTGGAGAIGSNLSNFLHQQGAIVTVVDNLSSGQTDNIHSGVKLINSDISNPQLKDQIGACNPDYIFHLAAQFANANSIEHPISDLQTNAGGTINVLEAIKNSTSLKKFTLISSSCVYGNSNDLMSESTPLNPGTPYAISKLASEYYTQLYQSYYNVPSVILRYFNVYGPGERPGKYRNVIPNFISLALNKQSLTITGTGQETRSFTYVDDIIKGTLAAAIHSGSEGKTFNLGSNNESTIENLARLINELTENPAPVQYQPRRDWDDVTRRAVSFDAAKSSFGFSPMTTLRDGVSETVRWQRSLINEALKVVSVNE